MIDSRPEESLTLSQRKIRMTESNDVFHKYYDIGFTLN